MVSDQLFARFDVLEGACPRVLQTFVLGRDGILEPEFSSIKEWLGRNTEDYYAILAKTGRGAWHPRNDAHDWVRFNLRAHDMQAQTVARRVEEIQTNWQRDCWNSVSR